MNTPSADTPPRARILLVDDHPMMRRGIRQLLELEDDFLIVGEANNGEEALSLIDSVQPQLILLDNNMPQMNGVETLKRLRQVGYTGKILLFTVSDAERDVRDALRFGADGYLLKDMEPDEVVDAVQRAARGETVVAPAMTAKLVNLLDDKRDHAGSLLDQLTPREREILSHLAQGKSNKTIARALNISHDTVKMHVRHILGKLNLSSRVQAAVFAVERKLTTPPHRRSGREGGKSD